MGVRVIVGEEQGSHLRHSVALLFDSVTSVPLPMPTFTEAEDGTMAEDLAEQFLDWYDQWAQANKGGDLRLETPKGLEYLVSQFLSEREPVTVDSLGSQNAPGSTQRVQVDPGPGVDGKGP